ncbi:glycosyltransferase [Salinimicrobium sp. HB62]|uniref:glycosyltransferase n=1 Tax=Salinimicrobium sp. HB62 TaxID=3077781 RepID=UPI002D79E60A|nr:glycosyltransferase [Salinimicrobium sp. HB62]
MTKIVVHLNSTLHHFSQLLAGFQFLSDNRKISLEYKADFGRYPGDVFIAEVNGSKVFFDLADNSEIKHDLYKEADFYVKRMLLNTDYTRSEKLIPYGLYFPVYYRNPELKYLFLKDSSLIKYSLKYWKSISALLDLKDGISVNELKNVESEPAEGEQVIFRARLWDPGNNSTSWKKEERIILNEQRIEINRALKRQFGSKFTGGILRNEYSENICPDLVLPGEEYHRKKYFKILKTASIGIVNQGLEGSIGAKLGEYVANGLAILTTPVSQYEIPGFEEGKNYLTYKNAAECIELVNELFHNVASRKKLQRNNKEYYATVLHPGKKVQIILDQITGKISV